MAGWEKRPIASIAQHSLGKMLDRAKNRGEPQPYLRNLNVRWFGFDLSDVLEMRFLPDEVDRYTARRGDVLVCEGGYPGRAAVWEADEPVYFQKALHRVRFHEPACAKWFVYYLYFQDVVGALQERFNGAGIQHFTGEALARFELPLPPPTEQRRIVAKLDEAFEALGNAVVANETALGRSTEAFEAARDLACSNETTSWIRSTIGECVHFIDYRGKTPVKVDAGIRLITAKNVKKGFLQDEPAEFVQPESYDSWMTRGIPKRGDVLFTTEAPLANVAQLDTEERVVFAQRIIIMQPDPSILDAGYLKHMLLSKPVQARIHAKGTGATATGIKASLLRKIEVAFPRSLEEQRRVVERVEELSSETDSLRASYSAKLAALAELKKSLLHQAFTGAL